MATLLLVVFALFYLGFLGLLALLSFKFLVVKQTEMQVKIAQLQFLQRLAEQYEVVTKSEPPDACRA
jgi:hypothetical protein